MDDLLDRFGRKVREAVAAGSDADHLAGVRRRAARRRSRRAGAVVTGVLVAVALVITVVVTGGGAGRPAVRVAVGGTAATPAAVAGPAGWQAHDVGEARVWVPPGWAVASSGQASCPSGGGLLTEGSGYEGRCALDPVVASIVSLTTTTAPGPAGGRTLTVNGYRVIEAPAPIDGGRSYVIPDLHAQLTLHGPVPADVLASVGPSPLGRALIGVVQGSAPAGWQPVRYQGVEVMVPPGWSVLGGDQLPPCRLDPFAPTHPDAYIGTDDIIYNCPLMPVGSTSPPADGVWLRQAEGPADSALPTLRFVDGAVRLDTDSASAAAPLFDLQYDGVVVTIGLGPDPTVARAILGSIRTTTHSATGTDG